jgi:hypothetical protein
MTNFFVGDNLPTPPIKKDNSGKSIRFRVEITFKPELSDVSKYCAAADEIFERYKMPCVYMTDNERVYGDNGNPKDIGTLYAAVNKMRLTPWIVTGIQDAYFDNGHDRDTLMTNFFVGDG